MKENEKSNGVKKNWTASEIENELAKAMSQPHHFQAREEIKQLGSLLSLDDSDDVVNVPKVLLSVGFLMDFQTGRTDEPLPWTTCVAFGDILEKCIVPVLECIKMRDSLRKIATRLEEQTAK